MKIILFQDLLNGYTLNARLLTEKIPPNMKHILVVEDASGSGRTICHARDLSKHINTTRGYNIKFTFLSVYCTSVARKFSDIYFRIVEKPRAFEWNFIVNNEFSREASFDFDGILCIDPKP